jgi:hypothetical protein
MRRGEVYSFTKFNLMRQSHKITVAKARPRRPMRRGLAPYLKCFSPSWKENL